jgi:DNA-binding IclR family transcriptional regulator
MDDREHKTNMRCIAVPVLDREGRAVAALSATDDAERMVGARELEVRGALQDAAAALRQKLYPVSQPLPQRKALAAE